MIVMYFVVVVVDGVVSGQREMIDVVAMAREEVEVKCDHYWMRWQMRRARWWWRWLLAVVVEAIRWSSMSY